MFHKFYARPHQLNCCKFPSCLNKCFIIIIIINDKCSLYSDRTLIDRRNVSKDVSNHVNACKRFFSLSIKARVVAAALNVLEIDSIDGVPHSSILPSYLNADSPNMDKRRFIESLAQKVVDKYILKEERMNNFFKMKQAIEDKEREIASHVTTDGRHKCRFSGNIKARS